MAILESCIKGKKYFLERAFDAIQDGIFLLDQDRTIAQANSWMEKKYASKRPLIWKKCYTALQNRQDTCVECPYITMLENGVPHKQVLPYPSALNPVEWFEISLFRLEDIHGKVYEANQHYADMLGYSMEEVHQLHVWNWDTQWNREQLLEMIRTVDDTGDHFETRHRRKDNTICNVEISNNGKVYRGQKLILCVCRDIADRKQTEKEREKLIKELQDALKEIKTLRGILPLCSFCKKIREDKGYWERVDVYIHKHSQADISHSICPECMKERYPFIKDS